MLIDILDVSIIIVIGMLFYRLIRRTEAFKIIIGLLMIYVVSRFAGSVGLERTAYIFATLFQLMSFSIIIIFHPELRMLLRKIGALTDFSGSEETGVIAAVEEAVFSLSERKIGALIVVDHQKKLTYQVENAVEIGATCSKALLETIFHTNTPLHDGAVIVQEDKIAFAGCKLPLTGKKRVELGHLGTRHLAAIETAERLDLKVIVVSEETGEISIATNKGLHKVKSSAKFRSFFQESERKEKKLKNIIKKIKK